MAIFAVAAVVGRRPPMITPADNAPRGVHIRSAPRLGSNIIDGLPFGARVLAVAESTGRRDKWRAVTLLDGRTGYVSADYVQPITDESIDYDVRFLDVGAGEAIVMSAGRSLLLIDGGGDARGLLLYLRRKSLLRPVSLIVVTTPRPDHWRGIASVVAHAPVYNLWVALCGGADRTCAAASRASLTRLVGQVARRRSRITTHLCSGIADCSKGAVGRRDGDTIYLYAAPEFAITLHPIDGSPLTDNAPCQRQLSACSMVLKVSVGGSSFLFTGDIMGKKPEQIVARRHEQYEEGALIDAWSQELHADVLAVPNHGDETSSTMKFISAVHPTFALISADARFKPPSDSVVQRYRDAGVQVLTTCATPRPWNDNIICRPDEDRRVLCSYEDATPP